MRRRVVLVDGHRGAAATHPENTLVSFEAGLRAGADSIELDVRLSADGVPVVIHDETVDRTTDGTGLVHALTAAEIAAMDAGSWKNPAFSGEPVPTLDQALAALAGRTRINIELKASDPLVVDLVAAAVDRQRLHHQVMVSSFELDHLVAFRQVLPGVWTHHFVAAELAPGFFAGDGRFVSSLGLAEDLVTAQLIHVIHQQGKAAWVWTVDDPERAVALARLGVQAITTNDPATVRSALEKAGFR